jgi:hypothetical protein
MKTVKGCLISRGYRITKSNIGGVFFFFFFAVLGLELRTSHLLGRYFTTKATPPALKQMILIKIHYMHVCKYHSETLCTINMHCLKKKKRKKNNKMCMSETRELFNWNNGRKIHLACLKPASFLNF